MQRGSLSVNWSTSDLSTFLIYLIGCVLLHKYYTVSVKVLLFLKGKENTGSYVFVTGTHAFEEDVTFGEHYVGVVGISFFPR